ncbi:GntR family transcriptional regulator [Scopulibacillus cellulosilyticus]|uniref:GntR family transcriptional regulator n=1 Tax=Scopulibacillus cellulosilyticus TaxID=2665665 RepID=A0ABW2PWM7_9BACL
MGLLFHSKIPLYYQLKEDLLCRIQKGEYHPGDQFPSEVKLAEEYKVSRPTVRQAMAELVQEGYLTRGRGRGTFVNSIIGPNKDQFISYFEVHSNIKYQWEKLIQSKRLIASSNIEKDLYLKPNEEIYELIILKGIDQECLTVTNFRIPVKLVPGPFIQKLDKLKICNVLIQEYGLNPTNSKQFFQSIKAPKEISLLLDIAPGSPLTLQKDIFYCFNKPMAIVEMMFRGDRFEVEISPDSENPNSKIRMKLIDDRK